MKKKQIITPPGKSRKKGIRWYDVSITAFAIVLLGGFLVWLVLRTYLLEKHEYEMQQRYEASLPSPGVPIDHKLVCMVNNTYMGENQIQVMVQNKTYYGCCDKCVRDIQTDEKVRFAVDPYSKVMVDKAIAFITMRPGKPGTILYFESEQNAKKYLNK